MGSTSHLKALAILAGTAIAGNAASNGTPENIAVKVPPISQDDCTLQLKPVSASEALASIDLLAADPTYVLRVSNRCAQA